MYSSPAECLHFVSLFDFLWDFVSRGPLFYVYGSPTKWCGMGQGGTMSAISARNETSVLHPGPALEIIFEECGGVWVQGTRPRTLLETVLQPWSSSTVPHPSPFTSALNSWKHPGG
jgi:hypothetical protein